MWTLSFSWFLGLWVRFTVAVTGPERTAEIHFPAGMSPSPHLGRQHVDRESRTYWQALFTALDGTSRAHPALQRRPLKLGTPWDGFLRLHLAGAFAPIPARRLFSGDGGGDGGEVIEAAQAFALKALADVQLEPV